MPVPASHLSCDVTEGVKGRQPGSPVPLLFSGACISLAGSNPRPTAHCLAAATSLSAGPRSWANLLPSPLPQELYSLPTRPCYKPYKWHCMTCSVVPELLLKMQQHALQVGRASRTTGNRRPWRGVSVPVKYSCLRMG